MGIDKIATLLLLDQREAISGDVMLECMKTETPIDNTHTSEEKLKKILSEAIENKTKEITTAAYDAVSATSRTPSGEIVPFTKLGTVKTPTMSENETAKKNWN